MSNLSIQILKNYQFILERGYTSSKEISFE